MSRPEPTVKVSTIRRILTFFLILFVILKLTGAIDWPWWQVTAPFWVPLLIAASYFVSYIVGATILRSIRSTRSTDT